MKLIRDKLALRPLEGRTVIISSEVNQRILIFDKIVEEAFELNHARNEAEIVEELADLTEAISRFIQLHKISKKELEKVRKEKRKERGGFEGGYTLI